MVSIKSNIFDHVLYEFKMYHYTFCKMIKHLCSPHFNQWDYNMALESHSMHLRNLLEFFNCDGQKDCIDTNMILSKQHDFACSGKEYTDLEVKQYVNRAIDHLSDKRYKWDGTADKDLAVRQTKIPNTMFYKYMLPRIKYLLNLLNSQTDIRPKYISDSNDPEIRARIHALLNELASVPDIQY